MFSDSFICALSYYCIDELLNTIDSFKNKINCKVCKLNACEDLVAVDLESQDGESISLKIFLKGNNLSIDLIIIGSLVYFDTVYEIFKECLISNMRGFLSIYK